MPAVQCCRAVQGKNSGVLSKHNSLGEGMCKCKNAHVLCVIGSLLQYRNLILDGNGLKMNHLQRAFNSCTTGDHPTRDYKQFILC